MARRQGLAFGLGILIFTGLALADLSFAGLAYGNYPMSFENNGRILTIKKLPKKALVYGVPAAEIMVSLGLAQTVVGFSYKNGELDPPHKEALKDTPLIESYHDESRLIDKGADFIIGRFALNSPELIRGWPPVYVLGSVTLENFFQQIRELGEIFQIPERSALILADLNARLFKVTKRLEEYEPVKALVYDPRADGIYVPGQEDFATRLVNLAGGVNVFSDRKEWSVATPEEIWDRQPLAIIVPDYGDSQAELKVARLKADPILSKLVAVETDKILVIPLINLGPGVRVATAVESLAKFFHPSLF
jgi:iron complex transport system substrate-binding protein